MRRLDPVQARRPAGGRAGRGAGVPAPAADVGAAAPIQINAFDLINMVGGDAMNRMFLRGSDKERRVRTFTQFTSADRNLSANEVGEQ